MREEGSEEGRHCRKQGTNWRRKEEQGGGQLRGQEGRGTGRRRREAGCHDKRLGTQGGGGGGRLGGQEARGREEVGEASWEDRRLGAGRRRESPAGRTGRPTTQGATSTGPTEGPARSRKPVGQRRTHTRSEHCTRTAAHGHTSRGVNHAMRQQAQHRARPGPRPRGPSLRRRDLLRAQRPPPWCPPPPRSPLNTVPALLGQGPIRSPSSGSPLLTVPDHPGRGSTCSVLPGHALGPAPVLCCPQ